LKASIRLLHSLVDSHLAVLRYSNEINDTVILVEVANIPFRHPWRPFFAHCTTVAGFLDAAAAGGEQKRKM
jgi:hypothetical protein